MLFIERYNRSHSGNNVTLPKIFFSEADSARISGRTGISGTGTNKDLWIYSDNGGRFVFMNSSYTQMYSKVRIGTDYSDNAPSYNLQVDGTINAASTISQAGNAVIHAGNISSQTVSHATTSNYFKCLGCLTSSNDYNNVSDGLWTQVNADRPANTPGSDNDVLLQFSSNGVGRHDKFQINMSANSQRMFFRRRYNVNDGWSPWRTIAWLSDIPSTISWSNVTSKPTILTMGSDGRYSLGAGGSLGGSNGGLNTLLVGDDAWFGDCNAAGIVGVRANNSTSQAGFYFYDSNANLLSTMIATSGAATFSGSVYSNSDRYLKKSISSIPASSLERLFNVSDKLLKKYTLKQTGKESYGFIAQELERYIPEAVNTNESSGIKSVSYDVAYAKILASMIQEIKALKKQLEVMNI